jgi:hypothetical protein
VAALEAGTHAWHEPRELMRSRPELLADDLELIDA